MRIAVMGTGGVGGYFGARLAAAGNDVAFIARGAHLAAIRAQGLRIESELGDVHIHPATATDEPSTLGPADIVLFAVKLWDLEEAARAIRPLVARGAAVVSLQNGVEAEGKLSDILGSEAVMGGVAHISAVIAAPGVIRHTGRLAKLFFGEFDGRASERAKAFLSACAAARIDAKLSDAIESVIWDKFVFLVAFSGMTALLRKPIGPIREDPETWAMFRAAMEEAVAVAAAKGVRLGPDPLANWTKAIAGMPYEYRASMLADLERGSRLELPWLSGAVARMGAELGVPTPVNRFIAVALKLHANP